MRRTIRTAFGGAALLAAACGAVDAPTAPPPPPLAAPAGPCARAAAAGIAAAARVPAEEDRPDAAAAGWRWFDAPGADGRAERRLRREHDALVVAGEDLLGPVDARAIVRRAGDEVLIEDVPGGPRASLGACPGAVLVEACAPARAVLLACDDAASPAWRALPVP